MSFTLPKNDKELIDKNPTSKIDRNDTTSNSVTHILLDTSDTIIPINTMNTMNTLNTLNTLNTMNTMNTMNKSAVETNKNMATKDTCGNTMKKKNKCFKCRHRVGLLGFECKCKQLFCSQHRLPEHHQCTIDYRVLGRKKIEKQNPLIVGDKIMNRI